MRKSKAVKEIYAEIRRALGSDISAAEALKLAKSLVDVVDKADEPRFELKTGGVGFDQLTIDKVFADGGWKVMYREYDEYYAIKEREKMEIILTYYMCKWLDELE